LCSSVRVLPLFALPPADLLPLAFNLQASS
jgi:hypothetical protein